MRRLLGVLLGIAALLAVAAGVFWIFAPVAHYRASIEAAVLKATGRQLLIEGPVNVIFTPNVGLDLGPVRLSGPGGGGYMVRAANAVVEVEFLPLLGGTVRISSLTLTGADLFLDRRAVPAPLDGKAVARNIAPLRLGDVRLVTSRIHLADAVRDISFGAQDVRITWPRDGASLSVVGLIEMSGESFDVEASTDNPAALFGDTRLPLKVAFDGPLAEGALDGSIDIAAFAFEGTINLTTPSARRILGLYGVQLPGDRGLHSLSVAATLRAQPGLAQLRNAKFTLDATTGGGALGLRTDKGRIAIAGTLSVDQIDSAAYAAFEEPADAPGANGWSEAAVDLGGLRAMDIDLQINAKRAVLAGVALTGVDAELVSEGGRAELTITRATANAGSLSGKLRADVTGAVPALAAEFIVAGFDAQALFGSALGSTALAGRGDLSFSLAGTGTSEAALVRDLAGAVTLKLIDGSLDGVGLPDIARSVARADAMQGNGADAATNIKSLSATFRIGGGIAETNDLVLIAPFMRLEAAGAFGLAPRTLRVRVAPRFVSDVYGQPGAQEGGAFAMPFAALGPWDEPVYVPDWEALKNLVAAGKVSAEELQKLPEPARAWFTDAVAHKAQLPELPAVPGTTPPAAEPAPEPRPVP